MLEREAAAGAQDEHRPGEPEELAKLADRGHAQAGRAGCRRRGRSPRRGPGRAARRACSATPSDTRERLAALITSPQQPPFRPGDGQPPLATLHGPGPRRTGRRLGGRANRRTPNCSTTWPASWSPHDYDLKHVARLILNSHAYQREPVDPEQAARADCLFAAPSRRRMTAEQVVDSLFVAAGKPIDAEELNIDVDGCAALTRRR